MSQEHLWEGREGGLWGSRKICNCFFFPSLAPSLMMWAAPSNASPPAPAMQRLSKRFPGTGELQKAAGKQTGSKKGQELSQAQRQVGKEGKNKEKIKLCPKTSRCRSIPFFHFNFLRRLQCPPPFSQQSPADFSLLGKDWTVPVSSCRQTDCNVSHLHMYRCIYMNIYI